MANKYKILSIDELTNMITVEVVNGNGAVIAREQISTNTQSQTAVDNVASALANSIIDDTKPVLPAAVKASVGVERSPKVI